MTIHVLLIVKSMAMMYQECTAGFHDVLKISDVSGEMAALSVTVEMILMVTTILNPIRSPLFPNAFCGNKIL